MKVKSGERLRQPKQQKPNTTLSSSAASNMKLMDKAKVIAQYNVNAGFMDEFEQLEISVKSFNYSKSVLYAMKNVPVEQMMTYLSRIQKDSLVRPFGSIKEPDSGKPFFNLKGLIGVDAKCPFLPASGAFLAKVATLREHATVRITLKDFLFWFKSHIAKRSEMGRSQASPRGQG
ncbi:hypothetical protein V6N13_097599 [Hibiscus sabdariffa]|uniref:Uncharacterized protein n=2 Tax=Hibiscus sabdariffa TaxID=183260 RepID=A0ABR2NED3_9ROSI